MLGLVQRVSRADKMDFKMDFFNLDGLEWLKQYNFDLSDSLLMVSALKVFLAFLCFSFFFLPRKKVGRVACPTPPTPHPPSVAGPGFKITN